MQTMAMYRLSKISGRLCFSKIHHLSKTMATSLENCIRDNGHLDNGSEENKTVPKVMDQWNVVKLSCESVAEGGLCDVYLVGTRHYSQKSYEDVRAVINFLKPQVVFLELTLQDLDGRFTHEPMMATRLEPSLSHYPGEFRVAFEEALKYGCKVVHGDLSKPILYRRYWEKMPPWDRIKLTFNALWCMAEEAVCPISNKGYKKKMLKDADADAVENADEVDMRMQKLRKKSPAYWEAYVHERDQYMSSILLSTASHHRSVVAVVGKAHLQGIKKYWKQPIELSEITSVTPRTPSVAEILPAIGFAAAVSAIITGAIVTGIYISSKK